MVHPALLRRSRCLVPGFLALLLALPPALAAPAHPTDGDADGPAAIEDLRAQVLENRLREAEAKARLHEGLERAWMLRTPNQNQWDVHHYGLDLTLDPGTHTVSGTVTTTAEVLTGPLTSMELQFRNNMTVSAAASGGVATTWSHPADLLTVDLDRSYAAGETVTISVTYSGNPSGESFGWSTWGGSEMIWTLSEPFGASDWWPCKDLNRDKADSLDMVVTVPDHLIAASNGLLLSDVDNGTTRTFHWKTSYPIATYLVSLAIHPYTTFSDWYVPQGGGSPMEIQFYVFPDHYDDVQATYAKTASMIDAFAQGYGEYPFLDEKYGHAEFTWGGGMEHQTLTSLGGWSEDLISHELAHQWWGDMVTCRSFNHIWLNEGFATWSEAYWRETQEGFDRYKEYMDFAAYYGPGTIYVESTTFDDIFDVNLTYNKASWVVHMLRHVVGDTDFFAGLALYRSMYGYADATTLQLRDVMETVSGQDLDAFFDEWIWGEYYPVYRYSWTQVDPATIEVTIEQVQTNTGLFTMPIDVRVVTGSGTQTFVVPNSQALETYQLPAGDVQSVLLDPDRWILREVESTVTSPTFAQGILLVNGVDWASYGSEITSAYADSAFWGDNPITFWDTFAEPAGGYPANLPAPAGHGSVPADVIGDYSTVIWVGNDYNGDLVDWIETPIASYLGTGGNVLLLSRRSSSFLDQELADYLGVTFSNLSISLGNCTAMYPGLVDIPFTGLQNLNDTFSESLGPNSTVLFEDTAGPNRVTGVHAWPPAGGSVRPDGGHFVHLAGRPYRMDTAALRTNVEFILESFFGEPYASPSPAPVPVETVRLMLSPARPNPFGGETVIPFALPRAGVAELAVFDVGGRLVRTLLDGPRASGTQAVRWDGRDGQGRSVASGVYFVRLRTEERSLSRAVVLAR